jgi:peptidoglycan biosynthesis protein MviN/MurJ (putative lipid II flippase)
MQMNLLNTLSIRARRADPRHLAIVKGMVTVALFVFVGKLAGAMKEMAVAYRYGLAAEVDAYQFLTTLIGWPTGIWTSVLTAVLVPIAVRLREGGREQLPQFRAELLGFTLLAGLGLALCAWLGIRFMLARGIGGLPSGTAGLAAAALPGLVLLLPVVMLSALQSAWMLSSGRHLNTLLECIPALFIAGAVVALSGGGIRPLVWGTVAGGACQLLALAAPMVRRREIEAPRFAMASPQWTWFWQGFGIMLAGQALLSLTTVIDQFYAVGLGTGAIAILGYAGRILSLILGLAAIAASRATLPVFSQTGKRDGDLREIAGYWAGLMLMAGIVAMLACHLLAPWAVSVLFERGRFGPADTAVVAEALRYGLPQLPFYFSTMVLVSYALSQRRYGLIFWSGLIGFAGKVGGNLLLVPPLGVNGIALAATFVYALNAAFFWFTLIRRPQAITR